MPELSQQPRFAILASGRGSNASALMASFNSGFIPGTLELVLSNKPDAGVLKVAANHGYPSICVASQGLARAEHESRLLKALQNASIDHLLLAGYMRILSPTFLNAFASPILNIHPSLLPNFRGLHPVQRQWDAGVKVAGATVHLVTPELDGGPTILQGSMTTAHCGSAAELERRIRTEVEHKIYSRAVWLYTHRQYGSLKEETTP